MPQRMGYLPDLCATTARRPTLEANLLPAERSRLLAQSVCNATGSRAHLTDVTTSEIKREASADRSSRLEFESVYRENIGPVTAFFARRCREPQQVADLTSQTFVEAIKSAGTFQGRGSATAWLVAIARRVYANHLADQAIDVGLIDRLGGRLVLADDEVEDLAARIDAQRDGRELIERVAGLSSVEREAIELVDLLGLTPRDAAGVLGVSANVLRVRLFRAHQRLRKELGDDRF
jgi:RNA polymerase sigma factor (sigma-70 family)